MCFPQFVREVFMGCKSEADLPLIVQRYQNILLNDLHDVWIKVIDNESGAIVAASNWKVHPNGASTMSDDSPNNWLEKETYEKAKRIMDDLNERRRKANPSGFVRRFS
jgi:hypothetical protein